MTPPITSLPDQAYIAALAAKLAGGNAREIVLAALNAWPGAMHGETLGRVILPLTQETRE